MGSQSTAMSAILLSSTLLFILSPCIRSDPDPLQDLCVADLQSTNALQNGFPCKPSSAVTSDDFFYAGLSNNISFASGFSFVPGSVLEFPGLNTLGLSMNLVDFAVGGVVPPHTHPRATELLLVTKGRVLAGFVSTGNVAFSKVVKAGEMFVFPLGLMHFQYNVGEETASGVVAFNSQLPGVLVASTALFGSKPSIPDDVLATAFRVNQNVVEGIKSKFGS